MKIRYGVGNGRDAPRSVVVGAVVARSAVVGMFYYGRPFGFVRLFVVFYFFYFYETRKRKAIKSCSSPRNVRTQVASNSKTIAKEKNKNSEPVTLLLRSDGKYRDTNLRKYMY